MPFKKFNGVINIRMVRFDVLKYICIDMTLFYERTISQLIHKKCDFCGICTCSYY